MNRLIAACCLTAALLVGTVSCGHGDTPVMPERPERPVPGGDEPSDSTGTGSNEDPSDPSDPYAPYDPCEAPVSADTIRLTVAGDAWRRLTLAGADTVSIEADAAGHVTVVSHGSTALELPSLHGVSVIDLSGYK